jgi:5,6-dimethylbenzimidazole synthase
MLHQFNGLRRNSLRNGTWNFKGRNRENLRGFRECNRDQRMQAPTRAPPCVAHYGCLPSDCPHTDLTSMVQVPSTSGDPSIMRFDDAFRTQLRDLLIWRRDVRRFRSEALPTGVLERLVDMACFAPSVGLSQPWRFVIVDDPLRRRAILEDFRSCNADALKSYAGGLATRYAELKLAGLQEAPRHLAVFADPATGIGHGLGRRTMPEMAEYSVVAAIHTMWLAARAEGIGLGWVSILNPDRAKKLLDVPESWRLIGYFCLGYPQTEENSPELERAGWERRHDPEMFILRR